MKILSFSFIVQYWYLLAADPCDFLGEIIYRCLLTLRHVAVSWTTVAHGPWAKSHSVTKQLFVSNPYAITFWWWNLLLKAYRIRYGHQCVEKGLIPMEDGENVMQLIQDANIMLEKVNEPKLQLQNYLRSQIVNSKTETFKFYFK